MIKSCEDVRTKEEFLECCNRRNVLTKMGLKETARMIRWNERCTISPDLLFLLQDTAFTGLSPGPLG
ncbi:hypothetical protein LCGC14_1751260 [marine sediment metagenome]|uniref:Uncharacterized protein n=1 Tax=marine sediment metagenome TaxID=412755 RepID=A0A0F9HR39_9ZZZZ